MGVGDGVEWVFIRAERHSWGWWKGRQLEQKKIRTSSIFLRNYDGVLLYSFMCKNGRRKGLLYLGGGDISHKGSYSSCTAQPTHAQYLHIIPPKNFNQVTFLKIQIPSITLTNVSNLALQIPLFHLVHSIFCCLKFTNRITIRTILIIIERN